MSCVHPHALSERGCELQYWHWMKLNGCPLSDASAHVDPSSIRRSTQNTRTDRRPSSRSDPLRTALPRSSMDGLERSVRALFTYRDPTKSAHETSGTGAGGEHDDRAHAIVVIAIGTIDPSFDPVCGSSPTRGVGARPAASSRPGSAAGQLTKGSSRTAPASRSIDELRRRWAVSTRDLHILAASQDGSQSRFAS